ncbi:MAG: hypothetical protein NTU43_12820 [Bacteroidetes bacterium]|nr:hypothetical protein [Bacteroidota bacterium]
MHMFTAMYAQNTFTDFNTVSGALSSNDSRNANVSYMLSKMKNPLTMGATLSYFNNNMSFAVITTNSLNLNAGYKFFKKKVNATCGITFSDNTINNSSSGSQIMNNLGLKYTLKKKIDFSVNGSINMYKYGSDKPGISYRENLFRTAITYKF